MNTKKLTLALMGATLLSASALAETGAPSLVNYDVNGDGTTEEGEKAYKITSADDLYWFANYANQGGDNATANAVLTSDIVVNENVFDNDGNLNQGTFREWTLIGYYNNDDDKVDYAGTFDGNGHTISGLYFNDSSRKNVGLFGRITTDATIKNVGVIDSYFRGKESVGGVCGRNSGTIANCYNAGEVSGDDGSSEIGGVCGFNFGGAITNCYNAGKVSGDDNCIGGLCGYNNGGRITNCYNVGEISYGCHYAGGVCGYNNGTIENCYNTGEVNGGNSVGGVCGYNGDGTIENCYNTSEVNANQGVGGVCGYNGEGTIENCYNTGEVSGDSLIGGVCGKNSGFITNCYNTGEVSGGNESSRIGGVCGYNKGTIENCYNTGVVSVSADFIGGVCGYNDEGGTITNCYNTGSVNGNNNVGGVCGYNNGTIENCYNSGEVSGDEFVAGICGNNNGGTIENCYNTGEVNGDYYVGGVCGENYGTITNCYNLYGNAVGYNEGSVVKVENKKQAQFKSGEVAYLLSQGEGGSVWGQDLSKDNYPCHSDKVVYASTCCGIPYEFSNDENSVNVYTEHEFEDGICQRCHSYKKPAYDAEKGGYQIATANDLYWFKEFVNQGGANVSANAVLVKDIVVNENLLSSLEFDEDGDVTNGADFTEWFPIGYGQESPYVYYVGTFDGKGYTISGLYFNDENQDFVGLFGCNQGTIQNVGVVDSYFKGHHYIGGVCGANESVITNCYNTANVSGYQFVGGVSGANYGGTITNCYNLYGNAVGYNIGSVVKVENKKQAQFKSGEVAYLLSQGCEIYETTYSGDVWGQDLSKDNYPCHSDKVVYASTCCGIPCGFSNDENSVKKYTEHEFDGDGFCERCGSYKVPDYDAEKGGYQIATANDLYWFKEFVNQGGANVSANAVLVKDIVVNANLLSSLEFDEDGNVTNGADFTEWFPIGYGQEYPYVYYVGTFDGKGYTISGLYFNDENQDFVGLFGCNQGTIQNVGVVDSYFKGHHYIGGVCGANESVITNCYNTANVSGYQFVGGVSGVNYYGTITNCYNTGEVSGGENSWYIGGVYGDNEEGTITNCYDFKVDGGTLGGYSIVVDNNKITLPTEENISLDGFNLEGWCANEDLTDDAITSEAEFSDVHTLYAKWVENSVPTAIKAVEAESNKTIKTIKDGQIVIIRNGVMYDMQGRKL